MLQLRTHIEVTGTYEGKTKYAFWKELKVGDLVSITFNLEPLNGYAPRLKLVNTRNGDIYKDNQTDICNYLKKLHYVER